MRSNAEKLNDICADCTEKINNDVDCSKCGVAKLKEVVSRLQPCREMREGMNALPQVATSGKFSLTFDPVFLTYTFSDGVQTVKAEQEKVDRWVEHKCGDRPRPNTLQDMLNFIIITQS